MRAVLCVLLACSLNSGCGEKRDDSTGPNEKQKLTASGAAEEWTHKDLLDHLNKKGLKLRQIPTRRGMLFGPAVFLVADKSPYKSDADFDSGKEAVDAVYCQIRKTSQEAKDEVGAAGKGYASGRFVFSGDAALISKIKTALP